MNPVYRMSEAGGCIKALTAVRLGYEPSEKRTSDDEERLLYYTWCEDIAALQLTNRGYVLEGGDTCNICHNRKGIHVEVETDLFNLTGHLDRRILTPNSRHSSYPVEIKSLGRFSSDNFKRHKFDGFPDYVGQELCYLQAEGKPGVYWIMNRDSGQCTGYIVNDFDNELNLPGFEKLVLPITFDNIAERLNEVEIFANAVQLPDVEYDSSNPQCKWCGFKYLCRSGQPTSEPTSEKLITASELYKESKGFESQAKDRYDQAKSIWTDHIMSNGLKKGDKFKAAGVSVSYGGQITRKSVDESKLAELVSSDILSQVYKESKPWEDIRPRITE